MTELRVEGVMFLLIQAGAVLMEKCPRKAERHGGVWFLPGGRREPGDGSVYETLVREMEEELGCVPMAWCELPLVDAYYGHAPFLIRPFLITRWRGVVPGHCLDQPGTELRWVPLSLARSSPVRAVRMALAAIDTMVPPAPAEAAGAPAEQAAEAYATKLQEAVQHIANGHYGEASARARRLLAEAEPLRLAALAARTPAPPREGALGSECRDCAGRGEVDLGLGLAACPACGGVGEVVAPTPAAPEVGGEADGAAGALRDIRLGADRLRAFVYAHTADNQRRAALLGDLAALAAARARETADAATLAWLEQAPPGVLIECDGGLCTVTTGTWSDQYRDRGRASATAPTIAEAVAALRAARPAGGAGAPDDVRREREEHGGYC